MSSWGLWGLHTAADDVVLLHPDEVLHYANPGNKKRYPLGLIKRDLAANGMVNPIEIRANGTHAYVEDGHHRLWAAKQLGWDGVPVRIGWADWASIPDRKLIPGKVADWVQSTTASTDGIRYAHLVEADVDEDLHASRNTQRQSSIRQAALDFRVEKDSKNSWVAHSDGQQIGMIEVAPDPEGDWVGNIEVHPDYRRKGVGRALWEAAGRPAHTPNTWTPEGESFARGVGGDFVLDDGLRGKLGRKAQRNKTAANDGGDCYEAAARYLMDNKAFHQPDSPLRLVHGEVAGQGPLEGTTFGHAWVEDGDYVIDKSNGRDLTLPKRFYYHLGKINDLNNFHVYTPEEARDHMLNLQHYGPWELTVNGEPPPGRMEAEDDEEDWYDDDEEEGYDYRTSHRIAMPTWYHNTNNPDFQLDPHFVPENILEDEDFGHCPHCDAEVDEDKDWGHGCPECGQILDTSRGPGIFVSDDPHRWRDRGDHVVNFDGPDLHDLQIQGVESVARETGDNAYFVPSHLYHHLRQKSVTPYQPDHTAHRIAMPTYEDDVYDRMRREGLLKRLEKEFHSWYNEHGDESLNWAGRGPLGNWRQIENFMKVKYPEAHRGLNAGMESAGPLIDQDPFNSWAQRMPKYETGMEAIKQYGYDPKEIAAGMLLLHNRTHPHRSDFEGADTDRLVDIARKRSEMQQDYEQRQLQARKTLQQWRIAMGEVRDGKAISYHWVPDNGRGGRYTDNGYLAPAVEARYNGKYVGHLEVATENDKPESKGAVNHIWVSPDYRGNDIGLGMFDFAKKHEPDLHHSTNRTTMGDKWVRHEQGRTAHMSFLAMAWDEWAPKIEKDEAWDCFPPNCRYHKSAPGRYLIRHEPKEPVSQLLFNHLLDNNGEPSLAISGVFTNSNYRNDGVAEALMRRLAEDHPGVPIDPGYMTPDGQKFHDRMVEKEPTAKDLVTAAIRLINSVDI